MPFGVLRMRGAWNHNTHYHRLVLRSVPIGAKSALDVGCGEGDLLADLAQVVPSVVGIDTDEAVLKRAIKVAPMATLVQGDFLTHPFAAESFDLIAAIASLHHMDPHTALTRVRELLRPGGVVVVIGLARPDRLSDYLMETAGAIVSRGVRCLAGYKDVLAPTVWPPPHTYAECRRIGLEQLPGSRFRRRLFFRYSLIWTKPGAYSPREAAQPLRLERFSRAGLARRMGHRFRAQRLRALMPGARAVPDAR